MGLKVNLAKIQLPMGIIPAFIKSISTMRLIYVKGSGVMNLKRKLVAILAIIIMLVMQLQTPLNISNAESNRQTKEIDAKKDETVYITLDSNGELIEVNVVNRIQTPKDGIYIDYGSYEKIWGLSKTAKYEVEGDRIIWQLGEDSKGFYYQGKPKDTKIPYIIDVKYTIDDVETSPKDMLGKRGKVNISFNARPNLEAHEHFTDKYFYQVQAELNLDRCKDIRAPGATSIISGRTQNLGFMLMPGKEGNFEISFETEDFAFNGFTMTSMVLDIENMVDIDTDEIKDGFEQLTDASEKLIDGTSKLKSGMNSLAKGVQKLSNGAKDTKSGLNKFKDGLTGYSGGVSELAAKAKKIDEELKKLSEGGQILSAGFARLRGGIEEGFTKEFPIDLSMLPPELAQWIGMLGKQTQGISQQLAEYEEGLNKYTAGISALSAGMSEFYKGLMLLEGSGNEFIPGLTEIIKGMSQLANGLSQTATKIQTLPKEIDMLIDGQTRLKEGLEEATLAIDDFDIGTELGEDVISFVSDKNSPQSLQFIYKTAEIGGKEEERPQPISNEDKKGFLKRLFDLFKT